MESTKLVSSAILGYDIKTVIVNDKPYVIHPPTIHKISGAAYWLNEIEDIKEFKDILNSMAALPNAAKALSCLIAGDESIYAELCEGTLEEVVKAIEEGFSLLRTENFIKLSILRRSVGMMIAKQNT